MRCCVLQTIVLRFTDRIRTRGYRTSRTGTANWQKRVQRNSVDDVGRKNRRLRERRQLFTRTRCGEIWRQSTELRARSFRQTPQHAKKL